MDEKELRGTAAVRHMLEGTVATVLGGIILWSVTSQATRSNVISSPPQSAEKIEDISSPIIQTATVPDGQNTQTATMSSPSPQSIGAPSGSPSSAFESRKDTLQQNAAVPLSVSPQTTPPPPPVAVQTPIAAAQAAAAVAPAPSTRAALSDSVPFGTVLLFENFSRYNEGDATDWGPNTSVKVGLDHRKWLVSYVDGTHPIGRSLRLPNEFYFECRYSLNMPDVTRGVMGWWKDPVIERIAFLNSRGEKYTVEWVIGCGNDAVRLNPFGPPPANKYYHSIKLPGAAAKDFVIAQPTGILRIIRDRNVINLLVNGQLVASGMLGQDEQFIGFEVNLVKVKYGTLFFTDFKIAR